MEQNALLHGWGLVLTVAYLSSLLVFGWLGNRAHKEKTLADFYLGGRGLGFGVLLLTLYATQYSGNTLIGFAATAYRQGFQFLVSVGFMMGIIAFYLMYAPRLQVLARKRGYITVSDFVQDRFRNRPLSVLVSVSGIIAMSNYVLSNLKAIGYAVVSATGGKIGFAEGIIYLSMIILVYESLGGLRSVAWTDVVQGLILLAGCVVIFGAIVVHFDGYRAISEGLRVARPQFWEPVRWADCVQWMSTLLVVSLGIALYPHAIQRIYSAKNPVVLRRAFQVMLFMPLVTTLFMVFVGLIGAVRFPDLARLESESITLMMLGEISQRVPLANGIILLFLAAVFAAIMSTIDSALLSISSMITQDIYRPLRPEASEAHLTRVGKGISWLIMGLMVPLAIFLPQTIWRLIEIKVELLVQIAPALLLGLHIQGLRGRHVLAGFVAGTGTTLFLSVGGIQTDWITEKPWGIHGGLIGLAVNLAVIGVCQLFWRQPPRKRMSHSEERSAASARA